jgi:hypothetical protein
MEVPDPRLLLQAAIEKLQDQVVLKQAELDRVAGELRQLQQQLARLVFAIQTVNEFIPGNPLPLPHRVVNPTCPDSGRTLFSPDNEDQANSETPKFDLARKTALDCALVILKERMPGSVHFRQLAAEAVGRGYRSPKGNTDLDTIERTFWDTLRRVKHDPDVPIVFEGNGLFRFEPQKPQFQPADEGEGDGPFN